MSRFQFWIMLIFIMNTSFVVVTDETNNPLKRPWLDLNLKPEDLGEPPKEIIISDQNLKINAQILEGSSSSNDAKRQHDMEWWFANTEKVWNELQSDPDMSDGKWKKICVKMIQEWKKEEAPLLDLLCKPTPYNASGSRRVRFKEMKERKRGQKASYAPDLLLCNCSYCYLNTDNILMGKELHFAAKHYRGKEYFLLEKKSVRGHVIYGVNNIQTLNIASQALEDTTG